MAKARTTFVNANKADLNLPDGTTIGAGESVSLDKAMLENLGVQMWIAEGLLVPEGAAQVAEETPADE